jgi:CRP/FNR family transcriptional regulator
MSPLFQTLEKEELEIINTDRYSVRFREGEVILKQGTQASNMISVVEGFTKIYIEGFNDRNLILDFVKPWQLVGMPGALASGKYSYTMVAKRETLVCFLSTEQFKKILDLNRDFSRMYLHICSSSYARSMERMVSLSQKQMHGRIADALIYLSEEIYESEVIGHEISRQDIADYTSMSKDSAIRILKEFERDDIVNLESKSMVVLDLPRLHSISVNG